MPVCLLVEIYNGKDELLEQFVNKIRMAECHQNLLLWIDMRTFILIAMDLLRWLCSEFL